MHKWIDKSGKSHNVRIEYPEAMRLLHEFGDDCDLMEAYKSPQNIDPLFRWLAIDSNVVGALCVIEDHHAPKHFATFFANADTLRGARIALLNAVTDFFPQEVRPALREALATLEMQTAIKNVQDCFTPAAGSATRGNGSTESSGASTTPATDSHSDKSSTAITANDPMTGG